MFPFSAGTCPECDSVASRPASRAEVQQAGKLPAIDSGDAATSGGADDSLAGYLIAGISVSIVATLIGFVAIDSQSLGFSAIAYLVGLLGLGLVLIGIIGIGVREGMEAHLARFGRSEADR